MSFPFASSKPSKTRMTKPSSASLAPAPAPSPVHLGIYHLKNTIALIFQFCGLILMLNFQFQLPAVCLHHHSVIIIIIIVGKEDPMLLLLPRQKTQVIIQGPKSVNFRGQSFVLHLLNQYMLTFDAFQTKLFNLIFFCLGCQEPLFGQLDATLLISVI